jgi:hypothetical protein
MASEKRQKELNVKEHRDLLIQSIRAHLVPAILRQGFEIARSVQRGPIDRASEASFPFEQLVRTRGAAVDLAEIQFAPHRRAAFRINAGVAPKEGMMTLTGHWSAEEICVHWLNEFFEMYASPRWGAWFALWGWRFRTPRQSDYDKLALRVCALVPEIDLALREGNLGPHMRKVVISR